MAFRWLFGKLYSNVLAEGKALLLLASPIVSRNHTKCVILTGEKIFSFRDFNICSFSIKISLNFWQANR